MGRAGGLDAHPDDASLTARFKTWSGIWGQARPGTWPYPDLAYL